MILKSITTGSTPSAGAFLLKKPDQLLLSFEWACNNLSSFKSIFQKAHPCTASKIISDKKLRT